MFQYFIHCHICNIQQILYTMNESLMTFSCDKLFSEDNISIKVFINNFGCCFFNCLHYDYFEVKDYSHYARLFF